MPVIGPRFFGMHYKKPVTGDSPQTPWHDLGYRSIRFWDGGMRWRLIETSKGVFNWSRLDAYVALCRENDCQIIVTLGQAPDWATTGEPGGDYNPVPPTNDADWTDFISALVPRLPAGSVYEVWNEPQLETFWTGTTERLIELHILAYETIKAIDPTAIVLSAGLASTGLPVPTGSQAVLFLHEYLPHVIDYTDAVAIHAYVYPAQPEQMLVYANWAKAVVRRYGNKPIWDTESGFGGFRLNGVYQDGPTDEPLASDPKCMPQDKAAAYLVRRVICIALSGAERSYFYGMDAAFSSIRLVTDLDEPTDLTDAAVALRNVSGLLTGATLKRFRHSPPLYSVDWHKSGRFGRILWCTDDETDLVDLTGFASGMDVLGSPVALSAAYEVTHSPVFLTA